MRNRQYFGPRLYTRLHDTLKATISTLQQAIKVSETLSNRSENANYPAAKTAAEAALENAQTAFRRAEEFTAGWSEQISKDNAKTLLPDIRAIQDSIVLMNTALKEGIKEDGIATQPVSGRAASVHLQDFMKMANELKTLDGHMLSYINPRRSGGQDGGRGGRS